MDTEAPARPEAVFRASRETLLGVARATDPVVARAQAVVAATDRRISIVSLTGMRAGRVEVWLGADEVVSHVGGEPTADSAGSVTPLALARSMVATLVEKSVGVLPIGVALREVAVASAEATFASRELPDPLQCLLLLTTGGTKGPRRGICISTDGSGLLLAPVEAVAVPFTLRPAAPLEVWAAIERLLVA